MAITLQMKNKSGNKVFKAMEDLPKQITNRMNNGNKSWCEGLISSLSFYAPESQGELKNSFSLEVTKTKGRSNQYKVVSNSPHAFAVNDGRSKGRAPPIEELMRWNKLDTTTFSNRNAPELSAAIALAKHIAKEGTQPTYFIEQAVEENINLYLTEIELELDIALREAFK